MAQKKIAPSNKTLEKYITVGLKTSFGEVEFVVDLNESDQSIGLSIRQYLTTRAGEKRPKSYYGSKSAQPEESSDLFPSLRSTAIDPLEELVEELKAQHLAMKDTLAHIDASHHTENSFSKARDRGVKLVADILSGPEMLTGAQFGETSGMSRQAVDKRRRAGELLALRGATRKLKYPDWQLSPLGQIIPGIKETLSLAAGDSWVAYRVLMTEYPDASGERVYEKLQKWQVELAMEYIRSVLDGDFG